MLQRFGETWVVVFAALKYSICEQVREVRTIHHKVCSISIQSTPVYNYQWSPGRIAPSSHRVMSAFRAHSPVSIVLSHFVCFSSGWCSYGQSRTGTTSREGNSPLDARTSWSREHITRPSRGGCPHKRRCCFVFTSPGLGRHRIGHGAGLSPGRRGHLQAPVRLASLIAAAAAERYHVCEVPDMSQPPGTGF